MWGFSVFAVVGLVIGFVSGDRPMVQLVLASAGSVGLFFVAMLWLLRASTGVHITAGNEAEPLRTWSRLFALAMGVGFIGIAVLVTIAVTGLVT